MNMVTGIQGRYLSNEKVLKSTLETIKAGNVDTYALRKSLALHESTLTEYPPAYVEFLYGVTEGYRECLLASAKAVRMSQLDTECIVVIAQDLGTHTVFLEDVGSYFDNMVDGTKPQPKHLSSFVRFLLTGSFRMIFGHCVKCCCTMTTPLGPSAAYVDMPLGMIRYMMTPEKACTDHEAPMASVNCLCTTCSPACSVCKQLALVPESSIEQITVMRNNARCLTCARDMLVYYKPPRPNLQQRRRFRAQLTWRVS